MYVPLRHTHPNTLAHTGTQLLFRWGMHVFKMFDTDINGSLDSKELANALKKLPKTRPFNLPPVLSIASFLQMPAGVRVSE